MLIELVEIMNKSKAIFEIRKYVDNIVSIGESINDIPCLLKVILL